MYYIRVAALGDVAPQRVSPTGDPPDNTNWSGVIEAIPADQPPSSPGPASLYVLDGSTLQVSHCSSHDFILRAVVTHSCSARRLHITASHMHGGSRSVLRTVLARQGVPRGKDRVILTNKHKDDVN